MPTLKRPEQSVPMGVKALAYLELQAKEKKIQEEKKVVRTDLEDYVTVHGKTTDKGHRIVITEHAGQKCEVKQELRTTAVLTPDAIEVLRKEVSREVFDRVVEEVAIVRDDALSVLIQNGDIPEEVAEKLFIMKENFAFKVRKL